MEVWYFMEEFLCLVVIVVDILLMDKLVLYVFFYENDFGIWELWVICMESVVKEDLDWFE